ncbi:hypothetical protein pb186bvf_016671 [Paramecium bursaria]
MNNFNIIKRQDGKVQIVLSEDQYMQFEQFQKEKLEQKNKKKTYKNLIPVMLEKFMEWMGDFKEQFNDELQMLNYKISILKNNRQKMAIKDLRRICQNETLKEWWISFLQDGWALSMIQNMKTSTDKTPYEKSIYVLLNEAKNPKNPDQLYKGFTSQKLKDLIDDGQVQQDNLIEDQFEDSPVHFYNSK